MKQWMKRIGALLTAAVCTVCLLAGCTEKVLADLDVDILGEQLRSGVEFSDDITKIADPGVKMLYSDLDLEKVEKHAVYVSSGASTEEIAVFEAKSEDDVEEIKQAVEKRIETQIDSYSDYGPDQVPRLRDVVLQCSGKFVIFVCSDHNDQAKEIINKYEQ